MAFVAVVGCAVRRVSAPGIALANAQMGQLVAVFVAAFGCAVWACLATRNWTRECADGPAGGWHCSSRRVADRRWPTARGERAGGGRWGDWHALSQGGLKPAGLWRPPPLLCAQGPPVMRYYAYLSPLMRTEPPVMRTYSPIMRTQRPFFSGQKRA